MADELITRIKSELLERKGNLARELTEAQDAVRGIEDQMAEVNTAYNNIGGEASAPPRPVAAAPAARRNRAAPKRGQTAKQRSIALRKAVKQRLHEVLPQDGEWHDLRPVLDSLEEIASENTVQAVLRKQPIERQGSGKAGVSWKIRWAPKLEPITESQVREFILAHKDGFTYTELAQFLGRSTKVAREKLAPFIDKDVVRVEVGGYRPGWSNGREPDNVLYIDPDESAAKHPPAVKSNGASGLGGRHEKTVVAAAVSTGSGHALTPPRGAPIAGTGKDRDLPQDPVMRGMVEKAKAQGFRVDHRRGGHFVISAPDTDNRVIMSGTPSQNASDKVRKDLRRIGVSL